MPEAIGNILSPHNETHFTNGIPTARVLFHWYQSYNAFGTNGREECIPSQPEVIGDIVSLST